MEDARKKEYENLVENLKERKEKITNLKEKLYALNRNFNGIEGVNTITYQVVDLKDELKIGIVKGVFGVWDRELDDFGDLDDLIPEYSPIIIQTTLVKFVENLNSFLKEQNSQKHPILDLICEVVSKEKNKIETKRQENAKNTTTHIKPQNPF